MARRLLGPAKNITAIDFSRLPGGKISTPLVLRRFFVGI
jgi:hypothetical protein